MSISQENASSLTIPLYKYSALPSVQSIRLIELRTVVEDTWSNITISLIVTNLHKAPNFEGLSYTWGNPLTAYSDEIGADGGIDGVRRYPIEVDGLSLMVNANLIDALGMLSDSYIQRVARKARYLWIDRVFINQEDIVERAAQVCLRAQSMS